MDALFWGVLGLFALLFVVAERQDRRCPYELVVESVRYPEFAGRYRLQPKPAPDGSPLYRSERGDREVFRTRSSTWNLGNVETGEAAISSLGDGTSLAPYEAGWPSVVKVRCV